MAKRAYKVPEQRDDILWRVRTTVHPEEIDTIPEIPFDTTGRSGVDG